MALSRTWYTRGNIPAADTSTTALVAKSILWAIKAALKDELTGGTLGAEGAMPAGGKWTCEGSSDSATANLTGTDLWGSSFDGSKIVRASSGAHSWIVLKSPVALGPRYLCIDYLSASDQNAVIVASNNAFTGGTTSARPTATKEWTVLSGQFAEASANVHRIHKTMDANGNFFIHVNRHATSLFNFSLWGVTLTNTESGELSPWFTAVQYTTGSRGAGRVATMAVTGRVGDDTATHTGSFGDVQFSAATFGGTVQANALSGKWDLLPVFVGTTTSSKAGIRGLVPDVNIAGIATVGSSEPVSTSQERMLLGDLLVPSSVAPTL
jgi:hypothetical protein